MANITKLTAQSQDTNLISKPEFFQVWEDKSATWTPNPLFLLKLKPSLLTAA